MDLDETLIKIGIWLRSQKSVCHYRDFVNTFEKNHGKRLSPETIPRRLRKLREMGFFMTPPNMKGQFFIREFMVNKEVREWE